MCLSVVASCLVAAGALLVPHARYELAHDVPNPYWGLFSKSFSYTPGQGPPSPLLLDTRPDDLTRRYIADYIQAAGTYPCAQDPAAYRFDQDPFLRDGVPCAVHLPVAAVEVESVYVGIAGPDFGGPRAFVRYQVFYQDGRRWADTFQMAPDSHQQYFLGYIHLTCWFLPELYPRVVPAIPHGVAYVPLDGGPDKCQR